MSFSASSTVNEADLQPSTTANQDHTLSRRPWRRYTTPWSSILSEKYPGSGTDFDPYLVDWLTNTRDEENPQTWAVKYKWTVVMSVAIATMAVAMASSTLSGATRSIEQSFPDYPEQAYVMGMFHINDRFAINLKHVLDLDFVFVLQSLPHLYSVSLSVRCFGRRYREFIRCTSSAALYRI